MKKFLLKIFLFLIIFNISITVCMEDQDDEMDAQNNNQQILPAIKNICNIYKNAITDNFENFIKSYKQFMQNDLTKYPKNYKSISWLVTKFYNEKTQAMICNFSYDQSTYSKSIEELVQNNKIINATKNNLTTTLSLSFCGVKPEGTLLFEDPSEDFITTKLKNSTLSNTPEKRDQITKQIQIKDQIISSLAIYNLPDTPEGRELLGRKTFEYALTEHTKNILQLFSINNLYSLFLCNYNIHNNTDNTIQMALYHLLEIIQSQKKMQEKGLYLPYNSLEFEQLAKDKKWSTKTIEYESASSKISLQRILFWNSMLETVVPTYVKELLIQQISDSDKKQKLSVISNLPEILHVLDYQPSELFAIIVKFETLLDKYKPESKSNNIETFSEFAKYCVEEPSASNNISRQNVYEIFFKDLFEMVKNKQTPEENLDFVAKYSKLSEQEKDYLYNLFGIKKQADIKSETLDSSKGDENCSLVANQNVEIQKSIKLQKNKSKQSASNNSVKKNIFPWNNEYNNANYLQLSENEKEKITTIQSSRYFDQDETAKFFKKIQKERRDSTFFIDLFDAIHQTFYKSGKNFFLPNTKNIEIFKNGASLLVEIPHNNNQYASIAFLIKGQGNWVKKYPWYTMSWNERIYFVKTSENKYAPLLNMKHR